MNGISWWILGLVHTVVSKQSLSSAIPITTVEPCFLGCGILGTEIMFQGRLGINILGFVLFLSLVVILVYESYV